MFTRLSIFVLICLTATPVFAQKVVVIKEENKPRRVFHSYFSIGATRLDVDKLNDRLRSAGIPEISENSVSGGLGMDAIYQNIVHSMEIDGLLWDEGDRGALESGLSGLYAQTSFGMDLISSDRFRLYPMAGVGIGVLRLRINQEDVTFTEALAEPSATRTFWQMGILLGVSLGASYTFGIDGRGKNIVLGVRGGYWYDPSDRDEWSINCAEVRNAPEASFTGPYAKITIGREISGRHFKRRMRRP